MAKQCEICGRGPQFGHRISHAHNVTNRRWNVNLQPDSTALVAALKCNADYQPWTDAPGPNETRPMNCSVRSIAPTVGG